MRICYVLLSPTFGMHQYTADLANRMAGAGHDVHLVTTTHFPRDRYAPAVTTHTPVQSTSTGLSVGTLRLSEVRRAMHAIRNTEPDGVHFTGPHLWNALLLPMLAARKVAAVHTLHDLHPHPGTRYGRVLYLWNRWVRRTAGHLLVHGERYRRELLAKGVVPHRLTCTPLMHLFVGYEQERALLHSPSTEEHETWALFFGRLEIYKGLGVLVEAARRLDRSDQPMTSVVIAGQGNVDQLLQMQAPANVEVRNRLIQDEEALSLFRRCGLVLLPYIEASQSALIAAAYFHRKPVIVTDVGALKEYVVEGETGWVIPPGDPQALADTLQTALADTARLAHMGQAAREWYDNQLQIEEATLQQMYVDLVDKNSDADPEVSTRTLPKSLYGEGEV